MAPTRSDKQYTQLSILLLAAGAASIGHTITNCRARHLLLAWIGPALAATAGTVSAQTASPTPQQTTASFDDWIVRCETRTGPPLQKTCEMVQFTQAKGQQGVLSEVAIGRPIKGQPFKIAVQLPIGIWLPAGVRIVAGEKNPDFSSRSSDVCRNPALPMRRSRTTRSSVSARTRRTAGWNSRMARRRTPRCQSPSRALEQRTTY
jgi:invasion protein IalB